VYSQFVINTNRLVNKHKMEINANV
jgi:hypothetical protein